MMSVIRTGRLNPKEATNSFDFAMRASRAPGCKVAVDPAGNVSFVKLFGTENDRTKQLLLKCAFLAGRYTRYMTAKQFLGYSKETHLLEHCDMVGFDDSLAWLNSVPT
jgi:hypothetical protein